jgi:HPt (histidine-containing phosphotransfer) domain-containing protein
MNDPLDSATFDRLCIDLAASGTLEEVVELFGTHTPEILTALRTGIDAADPQAVRASAHKLKGSAATLGATHLAERCHVLQSQAEGGSLGGATELVDQIEAALQEVNAALLAEVS